MGKSALVILHSAMVPLGTMQQVLVDMNFDITMVDVTQAKLNQYSPADFDHVVILGGPQSPYQTKEYSYLKNEIQFIRERIVLDKPSLGIALGAQLIAAALDGEIVPGKDKNLPVDISWEKIILTSAGEKMGLHQFTHENNRVLLWQNDYYEAPQHSTILATGGLYGLQAFSVGQNILGLQFHAEVTETILKEWLFVLKEDLIASNLSLNTFQKAIAEYMPSMSAAAKAFWSQWFAR